MGTLTEDAQKIRRDYMRAYMRKYRQSMTDEQKQRQAENRKAWHQMHPGKAAEYARRFWERKAAEAREPSICENSEK